MLHGSADGIKDWTALSDAEEKSGPSDAEGLFEGGRKLVQAGGDFAGLFGECGHHSFSDGGFMAD